MVLNHPFLTTRQAAALLSVVEGTIRSLIARGELRAIRVGREYRIAVEDLDAYVAAHATCPQAGHQGR